MRVIIVTDQELKSLGEGINRDYLELCLKHKLNPDMMDQPETFPHPAQGLYRKIHFTVHRWLGEVGSDTRVESLDSNVMKIRARDLRWGDMGLTTERWVSESVDEVATDMATDNTASQFNDPSEEALFRAGYMAARTDLRKKLEKYLAEPAKY